MDSKLMSDLLLMFLNNTPDLIYVKDVNSAFILASKPTALLMGVSNPEELEGKTDYDFYPKNLADKYFNDEQEVIKTGIPKLDMEEPVYTSTSSEKKWFSSSKIPFTNSKGEIIGIMGTGREITDRKRIQEALNLQKLDLAYQEGKAELAADILHNVGNVLNSVYVSAIEIIETLSKSRLSGLVKANELLQQNRANIVDFIQSDPKGQALLDYYIKIAHELIDEKNRIENEASLQLTKINIIKDILDVQYDFAKSPSYMEAIEISEIFNNALIIMQRAISKNQIVLVNKISNNCKVLANKPKLTHIIINLIKNAIESMELAPSANRILTFETKIDETLTYIIISDTGIGIDNENLIKIFNHGFTTKPEGKGFGLHASANSMIEMKGKITVTSDGIGKGSAFTLVFPNINNTI